MKKAEIKILFERLLKEFPEPKCELEFINPYTLMVSIILSAQATDKGVNKATEPLFKNVQTPEAMLALGEEGLREYVKSLNYYIKGKISAIVAIDNNKNVEKMLGILQKHVNKLLLTTYDDENARGEEGFILFKDDYKFYQDYKELFNNLLEDEETNTILICGSEVFVYQFYNYLKEIL